MFTASEIREILGVSADLPNPEAPVTTISIDSRQITDGREVCFIALKGLRHDGHQFLQKVFDAGVRNFVLAAGAVRPDLPGCNVFEVDNTIHALQRIAAAHRARFTLPCIGITGSNGKTWVKEWLYQLLTPDYFVVKSPRSFNSQIGVPLSVLQIQAEHTLGIFEAGISQKGEMSRLAEVIQPVLGILTHVGDAHQAGFANMREKLTEKLQLFTTAGVVLYCSDEQWIADTVTAVCKGKKLLTWNTRGAEADLRIQGIDSAYSVTHISYRWKSIEGSFTIPFDDMASIRNSITCCLALLHLSYRPEVIAARMAGLQSISMRLAVHQLPGSGVLINDAYSLDMGSLSIALESLRQHSAGMQRTVIISDIDQQHAGSYKAIAELFAQHEVDHVLAIGSEIAGLGALMQQHGTFHVYGDMDDFIREKPWRSFMPGAFLLKGARNFHFEHLAEHMQGRYHSAVLEIDLNALLSNLQFFMSRLEPGTKIIAMVKAAAYGSGGTEIARFLAFHNVGTFAVAYIDEGIELRDGGIDIPILVMNPDPARVDQLYAHQLEPEVYDMTLLEAIAQFCRTENVESFNVHIKVDTGMHRLGFEMDTAAELADWLRSHPAVRVASVFSHLSASGDLAEHDFTLEQIRVFETFYHVLSDGIGYRPERHILNTNGVLFYPEYQYEAVRLGIGLYGAGVPEASDQLIPVHTLKARISQIHDIKTGDSVGYDRAFVAEQPMRIGTINVGYADGLRRCAGNQKYSVLIDDKPAPILGKVCMDMTMVDLSDHGGVKPGDEVIIFGQNHLIDVLAAVCDTNAYEILTGISQRVARVLVYS